MKELVTPQVPQAGDGLAHGRLRAMQSLGCPVEVALRHDGIEHEEEIEVNVPHKANLSGARGVAINLIG